MIDYDKLKIAHELAEKLSMLEKYPIYISVRLFHEFTMFNLLTRDIQSNDESHFENIDNLITKLKELTQAEPKTKLGWYINHNNAPTSVICDATKEGYALVGCADNLSEAWGRVIYPTKAALIEAQLKYWQNMLAEEFEQDISIYCEPVDEYCNVSGIRLGKRELDESKCDHPDKTKPWVFGYGWTFRMCDKCNSMQWLEDTAIGTACLPRKNTEYGEDSRLETNTGCDSGKQGTTGCQHENNGEMLLSCPPQWKCIKCGEFYR